MSSSHIQPSPPQDRTLRMSVLILSGLAVIQALALLVALAPALRLSDLTTARELSNAQPDERVTEQNSPEATSSDLAVAVEAKAEVIEQANAMLEQADTLRAQGDLAGAFAALSEADYLVPNEPGILYQMAIVAYEMGRLTDSREIASRAIAVPTLRSDPNYAGVYQQLTLLLSELGAPAPGVSSVGEIIGGPQPGTNTSSTTPRTAPTLAESSGAGAMLRDDSGIPIGSTFGIIEARITTSDSESKTLRVATKAPSTETIDAAALKVVAYFYEQQDDGSIVETKSTVMPEWISPPVNWAEGEPELLELRYAVPTSDPDDPNGLLYHGYVVGIYYNGELQDSRAEPVSLLEQFPLELTASEPLE